MLAPTLFITGSAHPRSIHVVDGAAYLVPLEAPAEFSRYVREFWTAHPGRFRPPRSEVSRGE